MATIIYDYKEITIEDGKSIMTACNEFGVPFDCGRGKCGSCKIKIISGEENLSGREAAEDMLGLEEDERLACRCYIEHGEAEIDF